MTEQIDLETPYGVTQDILIRNDILRTENLSLQRRNAQLKKNISDLQNSGAGLEERLEKMQAVLDDFALSLEK